MGCGCGQIALRERNFRVLGDCVDDV